MTGADEKPWWQTAIIYEVYPRSFQDTNGDGVGDIAGLIARLEHLVELGVTAIWLAPVFRSPMADFGYDICDYLDVDPLFGQLADLKALIQAVHDRGLKLLLDLVPNHTSDQHPWFLESRASRASPKRDWYLWRDPGSDGGPPNNWLSDFGGSGWTFDEPTGQYYYHAFLRAQPDLNWRNPQVRDAMAKVMRFWLEQGVDGFRVDVLWVLIKDSQFRDNPINPNFKAGDPPQERLLPVHTTDQPEVHDVIKGLRQVVDSFGDRLLIGEIYLPLSKLVSYYGQDDDGCQLPFNFSLLLSKWNARTIAGLIADYERLLPAGGWPNWVLGNHDRPRVASRVGPAQARVAAMLLLTLRGTPTLYYGDEIGIVQAQIPADRVRDPLELNVPGLALGRDGARTPMPWDDTPNAGFSKGEPWLPLGPRAHDGTVSRARADPSSLYRLYRRLIEARRSRDALSIGDYQSIDADGDVLAYGRISGGAKVLVLLNLGQVPRSIPLPPGFRGVVLVSSGADRDGEAVGERIGLAGDEGLVIGLEGEVKLPASIVRG